MNDLGKKLLKLAKENRMALIELLNEEYEGDESLVFAAVGESEDKKSLPYCYDCGALGEVGQSLNYCGACRSDRISHGEIIEALGVISLGNGDFADISNSGPMSDNDF